MTRRPNKQRRTAAEAAAPPSGTVTLLFTDIEGSTALLRRLGDDYADVLAEHRRLLEAAFAAHAGHVVDIEGDAFFVAFQRAADAVAATVDAQRALAAHAWPAQETVRVRMGLHTGEPTTSRDGYVGLSVHRAARIGAAAGGGQVLLSDVTRRLLGALPPEVGVLDLGEHRLKDFDDAEHLWQLVIDGLERDFPPVRTLGPPGGRGIPAPATPTVGRDADVRAVADAVRSPSVRLLTLTGPGGVGKTRLAVEAARAAGEEFRHGAAFVALAAVTDARDVAGAVAGGLGAPARPGEPPLDAAVRHLRDREVLLVLDNFEQVLEGAGAVSDLLAACPGVTVLVTSREATGLGAERVHPVTPLDVPAAGVASEQLERFGAVAMFADRARARQPDFQLDPGTARHVAEICRRLDGLPLALQLAAARIDVLSPAELARRLESTLGLLVGGARDAPERQRTVRATIDWSFRLLDDTERATFAAIAVFAGGAPVEVAEAVTGAALQTLESLRAKHLLLRRGDRLTMLVPVREYALEQLARHPRRDELHHRLAAWCLDVAQEAAPHLTGVDRVAWRGRLDAELPNLQIALEWALEQPDAGLALELVWAWRPCWIEAGRTAQGLRLIDAALEHAGREADVRARARALLARAEVRTRRTAEVDRYRADLTSALELFRRVDDPAGIAVCLGHLAVLSVWFGGAELPGWFEEAIHEAERAGDDPTLAHVLHSAATAAPGFAEMDERGRRALPVLARLGDLNRLAGICSTAGFVAIVEGRHEAATWWLAEGLAAARRLGDPAREGQIRGNQGLVGLFQDRRADAEHAFRDALALNEDHGQLAIDEALLGLAVLHARGGALEEAAALAVPALRHLPAGCSADELEVFRRLQDALADAVHASAGPDEWARLERRHEDADLEAAIVRALEPRAGR